MYHMLLFYQLSFTCYSSIINYTIVLFIALINFTCYLSITNYTFVLFIPLTCSIIPLTCPIIPLNCSIIPLTCSINIHWKVPHLAVKRDSRKLNKNKQTGMIKVRTYSHIPALSPFLACRAPRHFTDDEGKL